MEAPWDIDDHDALFTHQEQKSCQHPGDMQETASLHNAT
jgi:hypothetical protein